MKKNNATIGLILYSIHSASGNVIMLSLVYVLVGIIAIISGDRILVSASVGIGVLCVSNAILISSPKDANSKWNKLRLALPVKRSNIITSQYLSHLLMLLYSIVLISIILFLCSLRHESLTSEYLFSLFTANIGASLLGCAIFYPLAYTIGENREEGLSVIAMLGGAGLGITYWSAISSLEFFNNALFFAPIVVLFILSYCLTAKIYSQKDI